MEHPKFEVVFPLEHVDFPMLCSFFQGCSPARFSHGWRSIGSCAPWGQAVEPDVITCNSMSGHWNGTVLMMQESKFGLQVFPAKNPNPERPGFSQRWRLLEDNMQVVVSSFIIFNALYSYCRWEIWRPPFRDQAILAALSGLEKSCKHFLLVLFKQDRWTRS